MEKEKRGVVGKLHPFLSQSHLAMQARASSCKFHASQKVQARIPDIARIVRIVRLLLSLGQSPRKLR